MKKLRLTALVTLTALMTSCGTAPVSLTAGLAVKPAVYSNVDSDPLADFSLELMKTCHSDGENTLISPISVMFALGMTSEGADGETLAQFETLFGLDRESLGESLNSLRATLEKNGGVKIADSIWFRDHEFTVNRDFLEKNSELYGADIFEAPFDATTLRGINSWVKEKTDGMITDILNEIPEEAVMYAIPSSTSWNRSNSFVICGRLPGTYSSILSMNGSMPEGIVTSIGAPSEYLLITRKQSSTRSHSTLTPY